MMNLEEFLRNTAVSLERLFAGAFGGKMGFCLLLFEFGDSYDKTGSYISNAKRDDMVKALRECADKLERHEDIGPAAGSA